MSEQGRWHHVETGSYDTADWFLCRCTTGQHGAKFNPVSYQDAADLINAQEAALRRWMAEYEGYCSCNSLGECGMHLTRKLLPKEPPE